MQTLDAPIYEVKQDSEWYKSKVKQKNAIRDFFNSFEKRFGFKDGFSFYHSEYFGVYGDTKAYDYFKHDLVKNPDKHNWYAFKKRSNSFKEIKALLKNTDDVYPFKSHDVFGLNNVTSSQWIGDRWFFGVRNANRVVGEEVTPIEYKEYLKIIMNSLD